MHWFDRHGSIETSREILQSATEIAAQHRFQIWDAIILAAAASAGCRLLLSEDLHDGFTWSGCTVVNPFAAKPHALLKSLLSN